MLDTGVKTLCTHCSHKEVCVHKQDFRDIIEAIENASITRYEFVSEISVKCKYYENWTETYRSKEAIL